MDQRKMMLPEGWYPHSAKAAELQFKSWELSVLDKKADAVAGIAPHAGWDFSGSMAWKIVNSIPENCDLIIIAGGHLSAHSDFRVMNYQNLQTPFGNLSVDQKALSLLCSDFKSDTEIDNTIEIMLPMIKYCFPHVKVLPVRIPPSKKAVEWGSEAFKVCLENWKSPFFLGSTDLSHYGSRFSYTDYGKGAEARSIVKEKDMNYLKALTELKDLYSLEYSLEEKTSCSAGAAAAAVGFARKAGVIEGQILEHKYSYEIYDSGSDFVGYGSLLF